MSSDKFTNASLGGMFVSSVSELFGWIEAHTALIGILITGSVAVMTIIHKRSDMIERKRANDIAERRLIMDEKASKERNDEKP